MPGPYSAPWPPTADPMPTSRANDTVMLNTHPGDHDNIAQELNQLVDEATAHYADEHAHAGVRQFISGSLTAPLDGAEWDYVRTAMFWDDRHETVDQKTSVVTFKDQRLFTVDQTLPGGQDESDSVCIVNIDAHPWCSDNVSIDRYDGVQFYLTNYVGDNDTIPTGVRFEQSNAIGMHWNSPTGATVGTNRIVYGHMGAIAGTIEHGRSYEAWFGALFGGQVEEATCLICDNTQAWQTFGFTFGGGYQDPTDGFPSWSMGKLALGGNWTIADIYTKRVWPQTTLDLQERVQLVRVLNCHLTNGSAVIDANPDGMSIHRPPYIFEYPDWLSQFQSAHISSQQGYCDGDVHWRAHLLGTAPTWTGDEDVTVTKYLVDCYASAIAMRPVYDGAATVANHNYIVADDVALENGAACSKASLFKFNTNVTTHRALSGPTTKATPSAVSGWIRVRVGPGVPGDSYYIPMYTSMTS